MEAQHGRAPAVATGIKPAEYARHFGGADVAAAAFEGVGGTPQSFARAGLLGLPLMVAIIGLALA